MSARSNGAFAVLGFVLFLTACGDLGMVLPSQGSYQVNAQVDGDYTLDTYSVITKNSRIRPYFVNSVVNDPDVRGITVFVQDYSGAVVSRKVQYLLTEEERQKPPEAPELPVEPPPDTTEKGRIPGDVSPVEGAAVPAASDTAEAPENVSGSPEYPPETDLDGVSPAAPAEGGPGDSRSGEAPGTSGGAGLAHPPGAAGNTAVDTAPAEAAGRDHADQDGAGRDSPGADARGGDGAYTGADRDIPSGDGGGAPITGVVSQEAGNTAAGAQGMGAAGMDALDGDFDDRDTVKAVAADSSAQGKDAQNRNTVGAEIADARGSDARDRNTAVTEIADAQGKDARDGDSAYRDSVKTGDADSNVQGKDTQGIDAQGRDDQGTDTVKTDSAVAPPLPPTVASRAPIPEDETVQVKQLDQYFPEFRILEDLAIGRYNLVFHVVGEKEILYKTFKPIYFIGDAKFTLGEIQSFLPVEITGGRLIPPGINMMLAAEVSADPRLDPYVIWHNGKKIIAQGRLSEGANSLFWKTPEQTGFHSIRVEVFPLLPEGRVPGNMIGKIRELSLPVSSRSEGIRHFNDSSGSPAGEFIGWYQFWGTLDDAKAPNNPERRLVSLYAQAPRWVPLGGIYGLRVGRDDVYTLPGTPFTVSGNEQGRGRMLFHLGALSEGPVLSLRFAGGEAAEDRETAELDLFFATDALILRIASKDESREQSLGLGSYEKHGFITVIVDFTIAPDHFEAELLLENPPGTTGPLAIALASAISGEGSVRFGENPGQGGKQAASGSAGKQGNGTMALNELAFSYARTPLAPQEEASESGPPEALAAKEEGSPETPSQNAL